VIITDNSDDKLIHVKNLKDRDKASYDHNIACSTFAADSIIGFFKRNGDHVIPGKNQIISLVISIDRRFADISDHVRIIIYLFISSISVADQEAQAGSEGLAYQ
jgi:hypothetical protein